MTDKEKIEVLRDIALEYLGVLSLWSSGIDINYIVPIPSKVKDSLLNKIAQTI